MFSKRLLRWYFALALPALVIVWVGATFAQDAADPLDDVAAAAAEAAAALDGGPGDEAEKERSLREQTIYVPYDELRDVFEREGRGVFLPYDKFQKLWQAARQQTAPPQKQRPPVGAVIAQAESEATVEQDVVSVVARLKIEVLAEGWHEVPLRLADAAIRSAKIGDEPARIVPGKDGYKLLVKSEPGDAPEIEVRLEYVKAFTKSPGQNSVSFQAPQTPVNRWTIRIPEAGVKVNVSPMIAATEVPAAAADDEGADAAAAADDEAAAPPAAETVVLAFVGAAPTVRIDWTPKSEGATGLAALATVRTEQEVRVGEGVIRTTARLIYEISRAELARLSIEVPANQKVVNVYDPNVRQWEVKAEADLQTVDVQLFEPARGTQALTIELERFSDDLFADDVAVPVIRAVDAGRQQGVVVVGLDAGLQAEVVQRSGLVQMDRSELPAGLQRKEWAFAFRYATLPYDLALKVEKVQPQIRTDELVEVFIEPEKLSLSLLALYTIERAGVFQLQLQVPAGFEVGQVRGHVAAGAQAAAVDSHQLSGDDQTELTVNLSRKATGKVGLLVELVKRLDDPNLLRPTGEKSDLKLDLPRVDPASIERCTGRLVVYKPDSLRVVPSEQQGVSDAISLETVFQQLPSVRAGRFPTTRPALTFAYTEQPASLVLAVQRRKPHVTARQLLLARIEAGVVRYEATFFFDILYSGVKALRVDVPADLAPEITNRTDRLQEEEFDPTEDGGSPPAEGYVAWRLTGETELLGEVKVELSWERQLGGELAVGTPRDIPLPHLKPADVDRAWGQIVIAKAETIDVQATGEPQGLRMIDPQQNLMPGIEVSDAALAFEFHEDWQLDMTATRYELTKVKRTSIERAVVRMAATLDGELIVQALYRLRSAHQRLSVQLPNSQEISFDSQPLWINGQAVALEKSSGDEYFVPLVGQDPDQPLLLELRYTLPGSPAKLELPIFPDEPPVAVQKVFLCVYVPERQAVLGSQGPWTDEMTWVWREKLLRALPRVDCAEAAAIHAQTPGLSDDQALVQWVMQDVSVAGSPFDRLPAEGTLFVYSTLRPAAPPEGDLRLTTIDRNWLNFLVFCGVAVIGLLMIARPVGEKFAAIVAGIIALVLCGVFLPTFAMQVLGGSLAAAVLLVLLVWLAVFVFWQTRGGRSLLAGLIRGRHPDGVVVRPIAPPPGLPVPAALGEEPGTPPDDESASPPDEESKSPAEPIAADSDAAKKDESGSADPEEKQSEEKSDSEPSPDEDGDKPEGGRTDG